MESSQRETRRRIWSKMWFAFFLLYFLNMVVVSTIIMLMKPLWYDINEFLIGMIGVRFNWLVIILSLIFIIFAHSVYLVIVGVYRFVRKSESKSHWINKVIPFIFLPVWDFALNLLFSEAGSEAMIVKTQMEYFSPIIWLVIIVSVIAVLPLINRRLRPYLIKLNTEGVDGYTKTKIIFEIFIIMVICILPFVIPLNIIPSSVIQDEIPPKPLLMAHRGASHLAPENTIVAAEQAVIFGAVGIEVDLSISYDGVIILMHDTTLRRTTDVETMFPSRQNDHVTSFTFAELRSLDAGSWFVDDDPFNTIKDGYITSSTAESYRGEIIPSLAEVINFTKDNGLLLDIDSKGPPSGHPYYALYENMLLTQLNNSGLGKDILINSNAYLAENMTYVTEAYPVEELLSMGSELVNTHHGLSNEQFKTYENADIQVMVWTVDSISRFSQLWCLGVDLIKTNNLHLMGPLEKPVWYMKKINYTIAWVVIIIMTPILSFTVDYLVRKMSKRKMK